MEIERMRVARCETVDDVAREQLAVSIRCKGCGRRSIVPPRPLLALAMVRRWPRHMMAIGKHLRCQTCGTRFPEVMATSMPIDSAPIGPTNDAELKREQRMLKG